MAPPEAPTSGSPLPTGVPVPQNSRRVILIAVLLAVGIMGLCIVGGMALVIGAATLDDRPPNTTKSVSPTDLVGHWRCTRRKMPTDFDITLHPDGTFEQSSISSFPASFIQKGRWKLRVNSSGHSMLDLEDCMAKPSGAWTRTGITWDTVESKKTPHGFAICGGPDPDPDLYVEFEYIP